MRAVDGAPADILRRDRVRMTSVATSDAGEKTLGRTVSFIDPSAFGARPGCVARIDDDNRNTGKRRLVFDKRTQLVERPAIEPVSLRLASRYPITDALQCFESNAASGVFRLMRQALADAVVDITGKAGLFATTLFKQPLCRFCAFLLESGTKTLRAMTHTVHRIPGITLSVRVRYMERMNWSDPVWMLSPKSISGLYRCSNTVKSDTETARASSTPG
jgi:hypothetical protein